MKTLRTFLFLLVVASLLTIPIATALADGDSGGDLSQPQWWWSKTVTVKATGAYSTLVRGVLKCESATLYVGGRSYTGKITQSWWDIFWNRCPVEFSNVPVNVSGSVTIKGKSLFGPRSIQGTKSVRIDRPWVGSTVDVGTVQLR